MNRDYSKMLCVLGLLALAACSNAPPMTLWTIDSLDQVGGHPVEVLGDPTLIETPYGKAVEFDGRGDRLLVDHNPLNNATEFTIEIVFKPYDAFPDNWEPRFFHIESPGNPDRRVTIELRLNDQQQWYLDTYIKSEISAHTLIDDSLVHPVNEWAHAAITYRDRTFSAYVNGKQELTADVDYLPIGKEGQTSIGSRLNQVHWFNGAIRVVRVTPVALDADEFLQPDEF